MSILDWIKNILGNGKKNAKFYTKTLKKPIGDTTPLEIGLYDGNNPITNEDIGIQINNGKQYIKTTDNDGIARLNINLGVGEYTAKIYWKGSNEFNNLTAYCEIFITTATRMEGTNINMTQGDGTKYQCAVYRNDNQQRIHENVDITINNKTYNRTADNEGLYKLNINLNQGTYPIKAEYKGSNIFNPSTVNNTITINPKPVEPPKQEEPPTQLWDYITDQGGGQLGQRTGYTCGPHSLMQCIYRLTGIELSEMELASICGTTTDGTDHDGLETGLAWFNRKYDYNLKMTWKNFSEVGFEGTQQAINNGACFHHILYRNQWGHYEVPKWTEEDPIYVLNSLGDNCGDGYCGYIEERTRSEHQSYINGISQKSVCIITRG